MNKDEIPDILVNKENFHRLFKESQSYRRAFRIANFLAIAGWLVVFYLANKGWIMLILLGSQYVAVSHIVQVVAHPAARAVCVVLSNGLEIRFEMGDHESKEEAVHRIFQMIQSKAG